MNRAQALTILKLPREQAVNLIIAIGEKAERWDVLQAQGAANTPISPTTPSGMTPVYLKPKARRRRKKPGEQTRPPRGVSSTSGAYRGHVRTPTQDLSARWHGRGQADPRAHATDLKISRRSSRG